MLSLDLYPFNFILLTKKTRSSSSLPFETLPCTKKRSSISCQNLSSISTSDASASASITVQPIKSECFFTILSSLFLEDEAPEPLSTATSTSPEEDGWCGGGPAIERAERKKERERRAAAIGGGWPDAAAAGDSRWRLGVQHCTQSRLCSL